MFEIAPYKAECIICVGGLFCSTGIRTFSKDDKGRNYR